MNSNQLIQLFKSPNQSIRLNAALTAGTYPDEENIPVLIKQCRHENDFFVRDMMTWALIRHEHLSVVNILAPELKSDTPQARSQALHTLSKMGNHEYYRFITTDLLTDEDDAVASTAWRAAAVLVPDNEIEDLLPNLISQLGRGNFEIQLSLSRTICSLGKQVLNSLEEAVASPMEKVRSHAEFTLKLLAKPELERIFTLEYAKKVDAINGAPVVQNLLEK